MDYTHTDKRYNSLSSLSSEYTYTNDFDNRVTLSLSIYSGGKLKSQIDKAKLDLKVADLDIDVAKQQLKGNVVTDYFTVLEYRNEVQVDQKAVDNYLDHLNVVNAKYELGIIAKTDVLSSRLIWQRLRIP